MMTKEEEFLDLYSFQKINEWGKIAELEQREVEDLKKEYKKVHRYIGSKIGLPDANASDKMFENLINERDEIQDISKLCTKDRETGFGGLKGFYNWYKGQFEAQEGKCYYCHIELHKIQEIFERGKLSSKRKRWLRLEIDKKKPCGKYRPNNCVLSCFICNNDKSDIFDDKQYIEFFQNRKEYLEKLYDENLK